MNVASIPGWSAKDGDEIICIAELKLGLIGMSCIVPGFSTMVFINYIYIDMIFFKFYFC
jgi:hypothetical protein